MNMQTVATCLLGVEGLVADELRNMNAENVSAQNGRVFLRATRQYLPVQISGHASAKEF